MKAVPTSRQHKGLLGFAALAICLGLVAFGWPEQPTRSSELRSDPVTEARDPEAPSPIDEAPLPTRVEPDTIHAATQVVEPGEAPGGVENVLSDYLAAATYPPTSRPLHPHSRDLVDWNRRHDIERPVKGEPDKRYLLTADRYWVTGDETVTLSLRGSLHGEPAAVQVLTSTATVAGHAPTSVSWSQVGEGRLESRISSANLASGDSAAKVRLDVEFTLDSGERQHAFLHFAYTPPAAIPAIFTGRFSESVERGSLQVRAELEVHKAGHYLIDCNLYAADGAPVAWTRFKGQLEAGLNQVPLEFFGRAIVDSGLDGPYRIGELRGARYAPGESPDMERLPSFGGKFSTAPHRLDEFSDAAWDSPAKQRKIAALTRLLETSAQRN